MYAPLHDGSSQKAHPDLRRGHDHEAIAVGSLVAPGMHEPLAPDAVLRGSAEEIACQLHAYREARVEHLTLYAFPWELKTVERLGPVIEALRARERAETRA